MRFQIDDKGLLAIIHIYVALSMQARAEFVKQAIVVAKALVTKV